MVLHEKSEKNISRGICVFVLDDNQQVMYNHIINFQKEENIMIKSQFDILRNFNLTEFKEGAPVVSWNTPSVTFKYVCGPDSADNVIVKGSNDQYMLHNIYELECAKMSPFAWVENKPVYRGDILEYCFDGETKEIVVASFNEHMHHIICTKNNSYYTEYLQWPSKFVTRYINVYPNTTAQSGLVRLYKSRDSADQSADDQRIACIEVFIPKG